MADHLSSVRRSDNMRRIRSKNTRPEIMLRSRLHRLGYRFRLHDKRLLGNPDIVLKRHQTVVFCHGCFWHQHQGCKKAVLPKTNTDYWLPKLARNCDRFKEAKRELVESGWTVAVFWECEIMSTTLTNRCIQSRIGQKN